MSTSNSIYNLTPEGLPPYTITIYEVPYTAKLNIKKDKSKCTFKYRGLVYGTRVDIYFNNRREFFDKVYARIQDQNKEEYGRNLSYHVASTETRVSAIESKLDEVVSHNRRQDEKIETYTTKVDSHTEELELLRKLVLKHELTISEQSDKILSLEKYNNIQDEKIVSLESDVSTLQSENVDLLKDVSDLKDYNEIQDRKIVSLENTIVKHENTIQMNVHTIQQNTKHIKVLQENELLDETRNLDLQDKIKQLEEILNSIDIQKLGEVINDGVIPTREYRENFSKLNELLKEYNDRLEELDNRTNTNVKILDKRSKENRNLLKLKHQERQRRLNGNS